MSPIALNSIEIKGYMSIRHQHIPLKEMNVLIGQNGAGKSNFISAFKFLRNIIEGRLKNASMKSGADNLLYYGNKITYLIYFNLKINAYNYQLELHPTRNESLFIHSEELANELMNAAGQEFLCLDAAESQLKQLSEENAVAKEIFDFLSSYRIYHFHDTSETAGVKKYASISDSKFLFEDGANLAPFLYIMKNTEQKFYERIIKTIQLVIPFFGDFVLDPNPLNTELIRLEWNDNFSDKTFTANQLSDGSLRFICMAVLLLQKNLPGLILLDEPELGLHPSAITILAGLLRKASKRSQVIVSTQSVSLVNVFEAEDIIVVEKKEAETVFRRLEPEKLRGWLEYYSLGDLWDKNIIGGKP